MATEMKVWRVFEQKKLEPVPDVVLESNHLEKDLESWIESSPDILGEDLLVVARQLQIPGVGVLDLLCLDSDGVPVIVELKRDSTPRQAIAQSLDYASWLDTLSEDEFKGFAEPYLKKPLADAFSDHFPGELPEEIDCQNHRVILVAPKLDTAAERIINYLAERYSMGINAVFFKYAKVGSEEILVRSMLVSEEVSRGRRGPHPPKIKPSEKDLVGIAEKRNVTELVNICRKMNTVWDEQPSSKHGASWRYSLTTDQGWRLLFRIDVSGGGMKTPDGELDLWIRPKNVAEVTIKDETVVRNVILPYSVKAEKGVIVIRLRTKAEAEKFVQQLKEWDLSSKPQDGVIPKI